jgi:hypothetical protein
MAYIGRDTDKISNVEVLDNITFDGSSSYTLQKNSVNFTPSSANTLLVSIDGVVQAGNFTVSGSTIDFGTAVAGTSTCDFILHYGVGLITTPADGTVTTDKIGSNAVTSAKITYPLTTFSSTGIDDNATSTAITIDSSENVGIGETSPLGKLHVKSADSGGTPNTQYDELVLEQNGNNCGMTILCNSPGDGAIYFGDSADNDIGGIAYSHFDNKMFFKVNGSERARIDSGGLFLVGRTTYAIATEGCGLSSNGRALLTCSGDSPIEMNRLSNDGNLIQFYQDSTQEGNITVSGTTVSYNGFTGTHWSRFTDNSTPTILRGTVLESLDEMCDWYNLEFDVTTTTQDEDGNDVTNTVTEKVPHVLTDTQSVGDIITYNHEGTDYQATIVKENDVKHMKSKVSDTVDAKNVYGLFVAYDLDGEGYNDFYVASVGSYVVRIKQGETIAKGDLLQSNGDGTAKVQTDDAVRSSSFAKVLSTTVIETYEDGSYLVPCSLMC